MQLKEGDDAPGIVLNTVQEQDYCFLWANYRVT